MTLEEQLKQVQESIADLKSQAFKLEDKARDIKLAIVKDRFGIARGDIVKDHRGFRYKVATIDVRYMPTNSANWRPMIEGYKETKSGWHARETYVSQWTLAE